MPAVGIGVGAGHVLLRWSEVHTHMDMAPEEQRVGGRARRRARGRMDVLVRGWNLRPRGDRHSSVY